MSISIDWWDENHTAIMVTYLPAGIGMFPAQGPFAAFNHAHELARSVPHEVTLAINGTEMPEASGDLFAKLRETARDKPPNLTRVIIVGSHVPQFGRMLFRLLNRVYGVHLDALFVNNMDQAELILLQRYEPLEH